MTLVFQSKSLSVWHWPHNSHELWVASACNAGRLLVRTGKPPQMVAVADRCGGKACLSRWQAWDARLLGTVEGA